SGIQYEFLPNRYVIAMGNVASTEYLYDIDFNNTPLRIGWSFGLGINTLIAPVNIAVMGSRRNPLIVQYHLGIEF
ncbi:MAG: hypothetical protein ACOC2C_03160, partial [Cyclonatronaceae bacterium]